MLTSARTIVRRGEIDHPGAIGPWLRIVLLKAFLVNILSRRIIFADAMRALRNRVKMVRKQRIKCFSPLRD